MNPENKDQSLNLIAMAVEVARQANLDFKNAALADKQAKQNLVALVENRKAEHHRTEGGGTSWQKPAKDGTLVRVTFPIPKLKDAMDPETKTWPKIVKMTGIWFDRLFIKVTYYKPVENFREKVKDCFSPTITAKLIKECEGKSEPKVSFEVAEKAKDKVAA